MADDPNKVGDRYNQVGNAASLDEIFHRTRRMTEVNTVAGERLRQEGRNVRTNMRTLREARNIFSSVPMSPDINAAMTQNRDEYAAALEQRQAVSQRFYEEQQIQRHRSGQFFQSQINQFTGSRAQASRINEAYGASSSLDAATRQMGSTGYMGFEAQQSSASRAAREIAASLREAAVNGAPEATIRNLGGQLTSAESSIGVARRGMQVARQMGLDPQSQFMRINEVAARGESRINGDRLREQANAGELPSIKELNSAIREAAEELNKLKEQFSNGEMSLEDFNKRAGSAADSLTKLEQQERAVAAAGGGGGSTARAVAAAAGIAGAGVNAAQQVFINQPISALNNRAQIAQAQNDQYNTLKAALGGNQAAMALIGSGAFQNAANFASGKKTAQRFVQGAGALASGVDTIASATAEQLEGDTIAAAGGGTLSHSMKAAVIAGKGTFNVATQLSDLAQSVTTGQTNVTAYQSAMEAQKAVLAVPSQFRQSYADYGMNVTYATRGAGGRREGMMAEMMNTGAGGFVDQMMALGIDPNKGVAMAAQGVNEQGSAFSMKQVGTARNLEKAGFGTMEENMGRMSRLANSGAADPNAAMGRIMEEAVSKGMDSSKAVSLMSDSISSLAQSGGTAGLGVDATGAIAGMLGRALSTQGGGMSDINRATAATGAISSVNDKLQDTSVSYTNMVRNTRLRQSGMGGVEAANFMKLGAQEMATLQAGGPEAERLAQEKGLNSFFDDKGKFRVNKGAITEAGKFLEMGGAGGLTMTLSQAQQTAGHNAMAKRARGEKLTAEEERAERTMRGAMGSTIEAGAIAMGFEGIGTGPGTAAQKHANALMTGTANVGANATAGEFNAGGAGRQAGREIKSGQEALQSLTNIAGNLKAIEKTMTPDGMKGWAEAAAHAAGNMEISAKGFDAVNKSLLPLAQQFNDLKSNIQGLNTALANLGGFKAGSKSSPSPSDMKSKMRVDGKQ